MMLEGVPNLALAIGYTNASWTLKADLTCGYVTARMLNHLHHRRAGQCTPHNTVAAEPAGDMLDLTSGYITRAAASCPSRGRVPVAGVPELRARLPGAQTLAGDVVMRTRVLTYS
jgi:monooxygenase